MEDEECCVYPRRHDTGRLAPSHSQSATSASRDRARHDEARLEAPSISNAESPRTPSPRERPCCPVGAAYRRPMFRRTPSSPSSVPSSPADSDAGSADIGPSGPASSSQVSKPGPRLMLSVRGPGTFNVSLKANTATNDGLDIKIGFDGSMSLDLSGCI